MQWGNNLHGKEGSERLDIHPRSQKEEGNTFIPVTWKSQRLNVLMFSAVDTTLLFKNHHAGSKVNNSYSDKLRACPDSNCHQIQDVAWKMENVQLGEAASLACITNANQPQRANSCKTRALITLIIPYSLLSGPPSSKALSDFCRQQKGGGTWEGTREKLGGKSSSVVWQMNASRRGRSCFSQTPLTFEKTS